MTQDEIQEIVNEAAKGLANWIVSDEFLHRFAALLEARVVKKHEECDRCDMLTELIELHNIKCRQQGPTIGGVPDYYWMIRIPSDEALRAGIQQKTALDLTKPVPTKAGG